MIGHAPAMSTDGSVVERVRQLETEKDALLDYVQDTVDRTAQLSHKFEVCEKERKERTV